MIFVCGISEPRANEHRGGRKPKRKCSSHFATMAELLEHLKTVHRVKMGDIDFRQNAEAGC